MFYWGLLYIPPRLHLPAVLQSLLELYVKEHPLPHFKDCVVSFLHIYDASLSAKRVRDYDNLDSQECKRILDTVACFLLTDDSGIFCDTFHRTEFGNKDATILTIMEKEQFPEWLLEQKNAQNNLSDF